MNLVNKKLLKGLPDFTLLSQVAQLSADEKSAQKSVGYVVKKHIGVNLSHQSNI